MADWNAKLLDDLQADVAARLESDPFFSDITVLRQDKGVTRADLGEALGSISTKAGKAGICVIVLMTEVAEPEGELPGPCVTFTQEVQVIESPMINSSDQGTKKRAGEVAMNVLNLLHRFIPSPYGNVLMASSRPIVTQPVDEGLISYIVSLSMRSGLSRTDQVPMPGVTGYGTDEVTLTAAPGAVIYYSLDGTYPCATGETSHLYDEPIILPVGTHRLRAVATAEGRIPSNVLSALLTITD